MDDDVLRVTALTPAVAPEAEPAAPSEPVNTAVTHEAVGNEEAQPVENSAATEEVESATPQAADALGEQAEVTAETEPEAPKKPARGVQKALDRLTARAVEAETRANQSQDALTKLIATIQARQVPQAKPVPQSDAPKREQFPDWEQYNAAVARHEATQEVRRAFAQLGQQAQVQTQQQKFQDQAKTMTDKIVSSVAKGPERFKDWDDVVVASELATPPSLVAAIGTSDDPASVMYQIGKNPELHSRLVNMSPQQQLYEIGKMSVVPTAKAVVSKAPAPARPIGGARAGVGSLEYNENFTPQQHKAWLARQSNGA